ncbi:efflux RND transporter periplasmic adaptor subunit [Gaoshiqia sp. Z1-71]|uniref:efflux RND transporter periplasmic adaptor subunit n=1 Tax=Gaoshiqia hydrogeniformans TaxID=3290090 RepID=UPI003BF80D64
MKQLSVFLNVIIAIALIFSSCTSEDAKSEQPTVVKTTGIERVRVIRLQQEEIDRMVEYTSTLQPLNEVHMAPASPGKIEAIKVEVGDRVRKNQLLVQMNDAQLVQARIQKNNLETDYSRLQVLNQTGSISKQQFDQLESQYESAKENVAYLEDNTSLLAPFDGIVSGKYFEAGEMYSGSPVSSIGKAAILSVIQIDKLKAIINVSEQYFPNIRKGMRTDIRFDVYPDQVFTGEIFRIAPTINPQSRSFEVEVLMTNTDNRLRPGMFGRVSLSLEKTQALVLPSIAVLKMQGSNNRYLFVEENGKAKRIDVTVGKRYNDKVEVISDQLHAGDKVIVEGQLRLLEGVDVQAEN